MGIVRGEMPFEEDFTRIPNAWVRNKALSRKARGLLVEMMSHKPGFHITLAALQDAGPEGRDALRTAIDELRLAGYLEVQQGRGERGRVTEVEYRLVDPSPVSGNPTAVDYPTVVGLSDSGKPDTRPSLIEEQALLSDVGSSDAGSKYSEQVRRLCALLADLIRANGHKVGVVGEQWWAACDRLLRLDAVAAADAEAVMRWATSDEFWQANIRSMPKFREKYSMLRSRMNSAGRRQSAEQAQIQPGEEWMYR